MDIIREIINYENKIILLKDENMELKEKIIKLELKIIALRDKLEKGGKLK